MAEILASNVQAVCEKRVDDGSIWDPHASLLTDIESLESYGRNCSSGDKNMTHAFNKFFFEQLISIFCGLFRPSLHYDYSEGQVSKF